MIRRLIPASLCAAVLLSLPVAANAQVGLAPQLSLADDADLGLGARVALRLPTVAPLEVTGAFDFFFPDEDNLDYWELNANVNYLLTVAESLFLPYVGGGLNIARFKVDTPSGSFSDSEIGLNLLGGVRYMGTAAAPYAEVRVEVDGGDQVVFTAGLMFNVGPGL